METLVYFGPDHYVLFDGTPDEFGYAWEAATKADALMEGELGPKRIRVLFNPATVTFIRER